MARMSLPTFSLPAFRPRRWWQLQQARKARKTEARQLARLRAWPVLETTAEYQEEARAEQPLIKMFGRYDSAFRHPGVLHRRFKRHCEYFGVSDTGVKWTLGLLVLGLTAGISFASFIYNASQAESRSMQTDPLTQSLLFGVVALVICTGFAVVYLMSHWWRRSYTTIYVYEATDPIEKWRTTNILHTTLPRLAFVDGRQGDFFSGPTRKSGPQSGIVHLDLKEGAEIVKMNDITECYHLEAGRSTFTEVPARETYDLIETSVEAGEIHGERGKSKVAKMLRENWPWILSGIEVVIIFFMASGNTAAA